MTNGTCGSCGAPVVVAEVPVAPGRRGTILLDARPLGPVYELHAPENPPYSPRWEIVTGVHRNHLETCPEMRRFWEGILSKEVKP